MTSGSERGVPSTPARISRPPSSRSPGHLRTRARRSPRSSGRRGRWSRQTPSLSKSSVMVQTRTAPGPPHRRRLVPARRPHLGPGRFGLPGNRSSRAPSRDDPAGRFATAWRCCIELRMRSRDFARRLLRWHSSPRPKPAAGAGRATSSAGGSPGRSGSALVLPETFLHLRAREIRPVRGATMSACRVSRL